MKKKFADAILTFFKWKVTDNVGFIPKCVICVAPHTSNFDLFLGQLTYAHLNRKAGFLMKKSWFFFPLGYLFRAIGGIPVNRSKNNSLTAQLAEEFDKREVFHIAITPEGTRKRNSEWKKGFYFIALTAKVPILLGTIDYHLREVKLCALFTPTGDVDSDMVKIKEYYANIHPRHPEKFAF